MYLVSAQEMREMDRRTITELGIPGIVLMEVAGLRVADAIKQRVACGSRITVCAGHGNNGGDGLVAARHLANAGFDVTIWLVGRMERMSDEVRCLWKVCERLPLSLNIYQADDRERLEESLAESEVVIDSLLGTGLTGQVRHPIRDVIQMLDDTEVPLVVSVDVPSGVDTDTGQRLGEAVQADVTVTFAFPKWCHYLYPGADLTGACQVVDIGIPQSQADALGVRSRVTDHTVWAGALARRSENTHKGSYGHALVIGGSRGMSGAPALASRAVLKSGAGLVTSAVPQSIQPLVAMHMAEGLTWGVPDQNGTWDATSSLSAILPHLADFDAVAIGPGLGRFEGEREWLDALLQHMTTPVVLDADALNILADHPQTLSSVEVPVVLTPHPGEMARLSRCSVTDIEKDRPSAARQLAQSVGASIVLKGRYTIIAFPDGQTYVNPTGTPAMAKGGSGDVLTGMIAAWLAQGLSVEIAVPLAVYLHGAAGEQAANRDTEYTVLATDMIQQIGPALLDMMSN